MKRILMVSCEGLGNGGVQSIMMGIVKELHTEYTFDALLFANEKRYYDDKFLSYGGEIYRIPKYSGKSKLRKRLDYFIRGRYIYKKVEKLLNKNEYFAVHCNNEFESAMILKAAYKVGVPVRITHTHIISKTRNPFTLILNKHRKHLIEKYATHKVGCSVEACNSFYEKPNNSTVINNFYDDSKFDITNYSNAVRELKMVHVGRLGDNKNQLYLIDLLYELRKKQPEMRLQLIGNGTEDYKNRIMQRIKELDLFDAVHLLPGDTDVPECLSNATLFIFPSKIEGFGIVLIEAQAMGIKCFASDSVPKSTNCGGVTYLKLQDGPQIWAEEIDKYLRLDNVVNGYDVTRFSKKHVMDTYKQIYENRAM